MKKILFSAIAAVILIGAGYFAYQYTHPASAPAVSSVAAPSQASADTMSVSSAIVPKAQLSASGSSGTVSSAPAVPRKEADCVKAAIDLDWEKYTLKSAAPKTIKNKTYHVYDIWDEDYIVGPRVLVDTADGKIYTWTSSDATPIPVAQDKAFDKTIHTITGVMEDGTMMSVILKTDDGSEISVRRLGIDTTGLKSLKIGDKIRVTYTGVIKGNDTSRAFITKLENV